MLQRVICPPHCAAGKGCMMFVCRRCTAVCAEHVLFAGKFESIPDCLFGGEGQARSGIESLSHSTEASLLHRVCLNRIQRSSEECAEINIPRRSHVMSIWLAGTGGGSPRLPLGGRAQEVHTCAAQHRSIPTARDPSRDERARCVCGARQCRSVQPFCGVCNAW